MTTIEIHKPVFNIIIARPPGPVLDALPWGQMAKVYGEVISVRKRDGVIQDVTKTHNIITNNGDLFYSYFAEMIRNPTGYTVPDDLFTDGATPSVFSAKMELFTGCTTDPVKACTRKTLTDASASSVAGSLKAIDAGYPKRDDDDTDNDGAGQTVMTFRTSYLEAEANANGIDDLIICNDGSEEDKLLEWAHNVAVNKSQTDTLKEFVNHLVLGA